MARGNYLREAIILNISEGGGRGVAAIIPGRQLIEGRLLFEEIFYMYFNLMDIFVQEESPTTVWVTYFTMKDVSPEFKCFKN